MKCAVGPHEMHGIVRMVLMVCSCRPNLTSCSGLAKYVDEIVERIIFVFGGGQEFGASFGGVKKRN